MLCCRNTGLYLCGLVAWLTAAVETVFCILEATSLARGNISLVSLSKAAGVMNAIALGCMSLYMFHYLWKRDSVTPMQRLGRRLVAGFCIMVAVTALATSLALVVTIKRQSHSVGSVTSGAVISNWDDFSSAHIAVWAVSCLAQIGLYTNPIWNPLRGSIARPALHSGSGDSVMSEIRHSSRTADLYLVDPTFPSSPLATMPSPTFSAHSAHSLKSLRESLHQAVRPVSSRTRLVSRPPVSRDSRSVNSDSTSFDSTTQSDGFDAWDNANVEPQAREAVMQLAPYRGTALEPIPGSRPASPARPLNGPFTQSEDPLARALSPPLSPPPKMMLDTSRPPSPAVSEAHIHPLFRTESPTPAPATSANTVITASPFATQMIPIPQKPYSRMRSSSLRANSPTPLVHAKSFVSERSPSPPSREMTPPIPDFVLNSSPTA